MIATTSKSNNAERPRDVEYIDGYIELLRTAKDGDSLRQIDMMSIASILDSVKSLLLTTNAAEYLHIERPDE